MKLKTLAHIAHYGVSLYLLSLAAFTFFGIHLPGVAVDEHTAVIAGLTGLGIGGAGLKADL